MVRFRPWPPSNTLKRQTLRLPLLFEQDSQYGQSTVLRSKLDELGTYVGARRVEIPSNHKNDWSVELDWLKASNLVI
jgi:hypothetical protein